MSDTDTCEPGMMSNLNAFQRDLMFAIGSIGPAKGLAVKEELADYYAKEINHGQLYPNLDTLVDEGLVEKGELDRRTNSYELTPRGKQGLVSRLEWEVSKLEG